MPGGPKGPIGTIRVITQTMRSYVKSNLVYLKLECVNYPDVKDEDSVLYAYHGGYCQTNVDDSSMRINGILLRIYNCYHRSSRFEYVKPYWSKCDFYIADSRSYMERKSSMVSVKKQKTNKTCS